MREKPACDKGINPAGAESEMIDDRDLRVESYSVPSLAGLYEFRITHLPSGIVETVRGLTSMRARRLAIELIEGRLVERGLKGE